MLCRLHTPFRKRYTVQLRITPDNSSYIYTCLHTYKPKYVTVIYTYLCSASRIISVCVCGVRRSVCCGGRMQKCLHIVLYMLHVLPFVKHLCLYDSGYVVFLNVCYRIICADHAALYTFPVNTLNDCKVYQPNNKNKKFKYMYTFTYTYIFIYVTTLLQD